MKPFDGGLGMGEGVATLAASTGSLSAAAAAPRPPGDPEGSGGSGGSRSPDLPGGGAAARGYVGRVSYPGPAELGRGVVVAPGAAPPEPWRSCPRVCVGDAELARPGAGARRAPPGLARTHAGGGRAGRRTRTPCGPPSASTGRSTTSPRRSSSSVERLHFLVWANNYDARGGEPVWWHGRKAARAAAAPGRGRGRPGRHHPGRRHPAVRRRRSARPAGRRLGCRGGPPLERGGRPARSRRPPAARRPSWPRTSWPRSTTGPARPGSSPRPVRARPGS